MRITLKVIVFAVVSSILPVLLAAVLTIDAPAQAVTVTVNDLVDTSGGATCTLRNAITAANTNADDRGRLAGAAGRVESATSRGSLS